MNSKIINKNIILEKSLIGGIINVSKESSKFLPFIKEEFFFDNENKFVFKNIVNLCESHPDTAIEIARLCGILSSRDSSGRTEEYWNNFIASLILGACSKIQIIANARHLEELSIFRKLQDEFVKLSQDANYSKSDGVRNFVARAEARILEIGSIKEKHNFLSINKIIEDTLNSIKKLIDENDFTGIQTGFTMLDSMTGGLQRSDLIIIAARPSMGKTAFALNLATNIAISKKVAFISLEMSSDQLAKRIISSLAYVSQNNLRNPKSLKGVDWTKINQVVDKKINELNLFIDDTPGILISDLIWKTRRLASDNKLDLLIIDYLQLINISSSSSIENRERMVSEISRSLKFLAKELNIPIIALSQLSRRVELREDKRPIMSDLRESGSIEQDADIVMFLYRDDYYKRKEQDDENENHHHSIDNSIKPPSKAEIIIAKHRNGPTGDFELLFRPEIGLFSNIKKTIH